MEYYIYQSGKYINRIRFVEVFVEELRKLSWWAMMKEKGTNFLSFLNQFKPKIGYGDATVEVDWKMNKVDIYKQLSE